jgi:MoxR-like ATPase
MTFDDAYEQTGRLERHVTAVLLGKQPEVELALASFLAGGHILLDDIPGTGKTTLARAIAAAISGTFRRIQFTSDILPQDVTGVHVFDADRREFTFAPGPLFAHIVLADEINRGNPRAQSALLEAMSERQVTIDNRTYPLPDPFLVIATQNPREQYGTYPLPESQLDRFNLRLSLSYPDRDSELRLIRESGLSVSRDGGAAVLTPDQLRDLRTLSWTIAVAEPIVSYIYRIVAGTRSHPAIRTGASPRGAIGLKATAQALALLAGRDHVVPGDVRRAAPAVLAHRIIPTGAGDGTPVNAGAGEALVREIMDAVPPPL